jgi:selenocysteine lyase/cysteine desulfurase
MTKVWQAKAGQLELDDLLPLLNENTKLVQLSLVSFYNGFRLPWNDVAALVRHHAPHAVLSADITQAFGRVSVQGLDADIFISSTHKWTLGIHGGGVVGIPAQSAQRLTTTAGGWYHLSNAFDADRFDRAVTKPGAASYSVGMPSFAALYALNASLRYLEKVGIANIEAHANPLLQQLEDELKTLGIQPMCSLDQSQRPTGILAFQHPRTPEIHTALEAAEVHVMHHAGRIRIAIHGYNQPEDVERLVASIAAAV